jgi:hypothetical protein
MPASTALLFLSLFVWLSAGILTGSALSPVGLAAAALAFCMLALRLRRRPRRSQAAKQRGPDTRHKPIRWVVVDGSNVLFWNPDGPALSTVALVLARLRRQGFEPVVWFDANVGYKVGPTWLGPDALSRLIGLPAKRIFVAGKGQPADPAVLAEARARGACVVTNDRYRDWVSAWPEVSRPGFLIPGGWRPDGVWLAWPADQTMAA